MILANSEDSITGYLDIHLIKTDAEGNTVWARIYGGEFCEEGQGIQQTQDGGYIVVGYVENYGGGLADLYLLKTDAAGDTMWTRTFGGIYNDSGYGVQQTTDGGYIVAGSAQSFSPPAYRSDIYLIKTDAFGNEVWYRTFGGSNDDFALAVQQTQDGGYILTGGTESYGAGAHDVCLLKTNSRGDSVWACTFGGSDDEWGKCVRQTADGGYIISGHTESFGAGGPDFYLIKTDSDGEEKWQNTFGGPYYDFGRRVYQAQDCGYIVVGNISLEAAYSGEVYLVKTDPDGEMVWDLIVGGDEADSGFDVQQTQDGGYIVTGFTYSYGAGLSDVYLIRLEPELDMTRCFSFPTQPEKLIQSANRVVSRAHPNPFNPSTLISYQLPEASEINLSVYDLSGRKIADLVNGWRDAGIHEVTFDGSNLVSGVYFVRIIGIDSSEILKLVIMK
jgi:hypothetical protein